KHVLRVGIDAVNGVAQAAIHPLFDNERLRSLVGPDGGDVIGAEVAQGLLDLGISLMTAKADGRVIARVLGVVRRAPTALFRVEVVGAASRAGNLLRRRRGIFAGEVFRLHRRRRAKRRRLFLALAEITLLSQGT